MGTRNEFRLPEDTDEIYGVLTAITQHSSFGRLTRKAPRFLNASPAMLFRYLIIHKSPSSAKASLDTCFKVAIIEIDFSIFKIHPHPLKLKHEILRIQK